ncbi:MAG: serine/threonine-protein kinase, partial [Planctomycetota bacterium]|nr:serine/threonine-protein kinase [Planctomycetota bacterium]
HARNLEDLLKSGPLTARHAAVLISQVARGVATAHARGITHRDIKPANILLGTDGLPLLADFGLCVTQSLQSQVASGMSHGIAGTPAYMAPEVALRQGATPLSDVYSLGATLRALLTGKSPFATSCAQGDLTGTAILTLVRTQPLGPLRDAAPGVASTLARICDRATAFAPQARYESAERFAADLEAFVSHRPVSVHPAGFVGNLWLWLQRNRLAGTVGIAAFLTLTAGTIFFVARLKVERDRALLLQVEASRQRDAAVSAREVVETMNQFIARTFNSTRGLKGKAEFKVADAIQLAADRAGLTFSDRPLVEASVRHFLGQSAIGSGDFALAKRQLDRAMELRHELLGPTHRDTVATMRQQAELLAAQGEHLQALALHKQIATILNEPVGSESPDMLRALTAIGGNAHREGRSAEALETLERAVAGYRRLKYNVGADHQAALNIIVSTCSENGQYARAISAQKEIIAINTANLGEDDISTLNAAQALGWVYRNAGKLDLAIASYQEVLPRFERLVGSSHAATMHTTIELSTLLADRDAAQSLALALHLWESASTLPITSQYHLRAQIALGRALFAAKQYPRAREVLAQAVDDCTKARSAGHVYTVEARNLLAQVNAAAASAGASGPQGPPDHP